MLYYLSIMIVIIGAGITGLSLAALLKEKGIAFKLLEADAVPGGYIKSMKEGPYLLEGGPNSFLIDDELFEWMQSLGISDHIQYPDPLAKKRYVLKEGRYRSLPSGPISLLGSWLSTRSKRKILAALRKTEAIGDDSTVDQFFRTRLGNEITDYLVYPFISGIYAGDPSNLLVDQAFPQLRAAENAYGSFIKGMIKARKGRKHKGSISFHGGISTLVTHLSQSVKDHLALETTVEEIIHLTDGSFHLTTNKGTFSASKIVSCISAASLSKIIKRSDQVLADLLSKIHYPPVTLVYTAYKKSDISHPLDGFGALHNQKEEAFSLGTIFSSTLFPDRCPEDEVLLSTFVGGSLHEDKASLADEDIFEGVYRDHQQFLGVSSSAVFQQLNRWKQAIPQYDQHQLQLTRYIQDHPFSNFWFASNWIGGISLPACIKRAHQIAIELEEH